MGWIAVATAVVGLSTFGGHVAGGATPVGVATNAPVCAGAPPAPGATLRGPVLYVPNAQALCVAEGQARTAWVAVTLAQPAASRGALMAAAFGKNAVCDVGADGRATCKIEDADLAGLLNGAEVQQAAATWR